LRLKPRTIAKLPPNRKLAMTIEPQNYVVNETRDYEVAVEVVDNCDGTKPRRVIRLCHVFKRKKK
jgi:hypothetical protein